MTEVGARAATNGRMTVSEARGFWAQGTEWGRQRPVDESSRLGRALAALEDPEAMRAWYRDELVRLIREEGMDPKTATRVLREARDAERAAAAAPPVKQARAAKVAPARPAKVTEVRGR